MVANIEEYYLLPVKYYMNLIDMYWVGGEEIFPELGFSNNVVNSASLFNIASQKRVRVGVIGDKVRSRGTIYENTNWRRRSIGEEEKPAEWQYIYIEFDIEENGNYSKFMALINEDDEFPRKRRWISSSETYRRAVYYLHSLLVSEYKSSRIVIEPNRVKELFIEGISGGGKRDLPLFSERIDEDTSKFAEAYNLSVSKY